MGTKQAWRPRAHRAWTPRKGQNYHMREAYPISTKYSSDELVRIIPEADYQRLLELAGLKSANRNKSSSSRGA
jgi:hypothetical protein